MKDIDGKEMQKFLKNLIKKTNGKVTTSQLTTYVKKALAYYNQVEELKTAIHDIQIKELKELGKPTELGEFLWFEKKGIYIDLKKQKKDD